MGHLFGILWFLTWIQIGYCLTPAKVCLGTSFGLSHYHGSSRINRLRQRYENCTLVNGNLEISFLEHGPNNLSFLSSIQEVTGYVLLAYIHNVDVIPLVNLRVIRGHSLFRVPNGPNNTGYSLSVTNVAMREIQLTSLHEIMAGSVLFENNDRLCFVNTILWSDVLTNRRSNHSIHPSSPPATCGTCDPACETSGQLHCWGNGPQMCQKIIRNCSAQCDGNCYGPNRADCCHSECVGGCVGPSSTQCWACRHFTDNGVCVSHCPLPFIYNHQTYRVEANPNVKYAYGTTCVVTCPDHMLTDLGACISECGENRVAVNGICVPCDGPCPKECDAPSDYIHQNNINDFIGCTIIRGTIRILNVRNDLQRPPARVEEFSVFESVREITGALVVERHSPEFRNLSFFRNLRSIHGRTLDRSRSALLILGTSLRSLGLHSLTSVLNGRVLLAYNRHLCFVNTIDWARITNYRRNSYISRDDYTNCESCSRFCDNSGCWGPGADACVSCANYWRDGECVDECDLASGFYLNATTRHCLPCSAECLNACTGPGTDNCDSCRNFQDGPFCVHECPESTYPDESGHCQRHGLLKKSKKQVVLVE